MKACPYCAEQIQDAAIVCRFCNRDVQPQPPVAQPVFTGPGTTARWKRWAVGLGAIVLVLTVIAAIAEVISRRPGVTRDKVAVPDTPTPIRPSGPTMADFARIENGMTVSQVQRIAGVRGDLSVKSDTGAIYRWRGRDGEGVMSVHFRDDQVISKSQSGLR